MKYYENWTFHICLRVLPSRDCVCSLPDCLSISLKFISTILLPFQRRHIDVIIEMCWPQLFEVFSKCLIWSVMVESKYFFLWRFYGGLLSSKKRQAVQQMLRRGLARTEFMLIVNIFYSLDALLLEVCYSPQKNQVFNGLWNFSLAIVAKLWACLNNYGWTWTQICWWLL